MHLDTISRGKMYIGSTVNLWSRFYEHTKGYNSNIYLQNAFNKYGLDNFSFIVLEFFSLPDSSEDLTDENLSLISLEQKYLDLIDDKYNINPKAGKTRLGSKHSEETKALLSKLNGLKFKDKTHTKEVVESIRKRMMGENNPRFGIPVSEENKKLISNLFSKSVYVYNANTLTLIRKFDKHQDLVKSLNIAYKTVAKYKDSGKPYKNYIFSSTPLENS